MKIKFDITEIDKAAKAIVESIEKNKSTAVAFYGKMGAGKTTLIKEIAKQLGVEDIVQSPTFAIINEYSTDQGDLIYHFDLYRLENMEQAFDIGAEEYFNSGYLCLIEWPEIIENILPENTLTVKIKEVDPITREVEIS